jgi:hypothetical protein
MIAGGLLLFYADRWADLTGLAVTAAVLFVHFARQSRARSAGGA